MQCGLDIYLVSAHATPLESVPWLVGGWGLHQEMKVLKCLFPGQGEVNFQEEVRAVIIMGWGLKKL